MKKRKKLRRLDCVSATQFLYGFSSVVQLLIVFFRNKEKEESRQEKLTEFKATGIWPGMKSKSIKTSAWSLKQEKKERKEERKRKKELKRQTLDTQELVESEEDDLEEDYRLLKKMKKVANFVTYMFF